MIDKLKAFFDSLVTLYIEKIKPFFGKVFLVISFILVV